MEKRVKTIVVDLDGTILDWAEGGFSWKKFGKPIPEMAEILRKIKKERKFRIMIHTCRINEEVCGKLSIPQSEKLIRKCLEKYDIPFDDIWTGVGKPLGVLYIDDRAAMPEQTKQLVDDLHE